MSGPGCRTRILLLALVVCGALAADPFDDLARDFWQWRAIHQPVSGDDMARIDRPADWTPDWSAQSVAQQKEALASFEKRWKEMDAGRWAIVRRTHVESDRRPDEEGQVMADTSDARLAELATGSRSPARRARAWS